VDFSNIFLQIFKKYCALLETEKKITFSTKKHDFEILQTQSGYEISTSSVNNYKSIDIRLCIAVIYRNTMFIG